MEVPVYIVNGFLESGKTSFIQETMTDPDFSDGTETLLIVCEEGEVEYDEQVLKRCHTKLVVLEEEEELNETFLKQCQSTYRPERVMLELNGMWSLETLLEEELPKSWVLVQIITTIDTSTFSNYWNNMKALMVAQFKYSDTIIFNRCEESTDKLFLRRCVKPVNRKGQIIYESAEGVTDDAGEEALPFDLEASVIEIQEEDYGLWYMDAMDQPKKYDGKTVRFLGMVYKSEKLPKNSFVPGRFAMTCCADDIAFMGMICKVGKDNKGPLTLEDLKNRQFVTVTAKIRCEFYKEYRGKGPVLYATSIEQAKEPEDKVVYFT